jgi:hypothetical protein
MSAVSASHPLMHVLTQQSRIDSVLVDTETCDDVHFIMLLHLPMLIWRQILAKAAESRSSTNCTRLPSTRKSTYEDVMATALQLVIK